MRHLTQTEANSKEPNLGYVCIMMHYGINAIGLCYYMYENKGQRCNNSKQRLSIATNPRHPVRLLYSSWLSTFCHSFN